MTQIDESKLEGLYKKIRDQNETIRVLRAKLASETEAKERYERRITYELEPRIKREEASYDAWVSTDHAAEASEDFIDKVESLIEMVEEKPNYFVWNQNDGDVYEMILYLVQLHLEDKLDKFHIVKKNEGSNT